MKTLTEIVAEVQAVRPLSARQILRHLKAAGLKPAGARQRPQQWPENTPGLLLAYLGLGGTPATAARILSLTEVRHRARKGGRQ